MCKHRQVVGVGKGQGWGAWGEAPAGRVHGCGQELVPGGAGSGEKGLAGVRQRPCWENRAQGRFRADLEVSNKKLGTGWGFEYRDKTEARIKRGLMLISDISSVPITCRAHC